MCYKDEWFLHPLHDSEPLRKEKEKEDVLVGRENSVDHEVPDRDK